MLNRRGVKFYASATIVTPEAMTNCLRSAVPLASAGSEDTTIWNN